VLDTGFWQPGFFVTTKLDCNKANAGYADLTDDDQRDRREEKS